MWRLIQRKPQSPRTTFTTHYYTNTNRFEQSLDVWKPVTQSPPKPHFNPNNTNGTITTQQQQQPTQNPPPIVVLIVGSAWLGHRSFVYSPTNWWNSSGPRTFAEHGCTCVCVRHRGAFPFPSLLVDRVTTSGLGVLYSVLVAVVAAVVGWTVLLFRTTKGSDGGSGTFEEMMETSSVWYWTWVVTIVSLVVLLMDVMGRGSASFDQMLEDATDALAWVHRHRTTLLGPNDSNNDDDDNGGGIGGHDDRRLLLFGGYSSGGHVAASLLQRTDLLASRGLVLPEDKDKEEEEEEKDKHNKKNETIGSPLPVCDGVIMVSAVLAVRPPFVVPPSSFTTTTTTATTTPTPQLEPPRWVTDTVTRLAFGTRGAQTLPSPLHTLSPTSCWNRPHLLIGCRCEAFGLNYLDGFFSSEEYTKKLVALGIPAQYCEVESDHWNVLNSVVLKKCLETEMDWFYGR